MNASDPVVHILHGEDEYAIAQAVRKLEESLGDAATAEMNITRLDGNSFNPDDLIGLASSMPFLAKRRMVVLTHPLARISGKSAQEKFLAQLQRLPTSALVVLVENHPLTSEKDLKQGKRHWLERWADKPESRAVNRVLMIPKGGALVSWIQSKTKEYGGQITAAAAKELVDLVGNDPRLLAQEIDKLLAFVNYSRPIDPDDVQSVTAQTSEADIFKMVDAISERNVKLAQELYHRLMEHQDAMSIFYMVQRHFRLLLLARAGKERRITPKDLSTMLVPWDGFKMTVYGAGIMYKQAERLSLPFLESILRRLLEIDVSVKNGKMEIDAALDLFIVAFARDG